MQLLLSLRTDKIYKNGLNNNKIINILNKDITFYGDYDIDIYLADKNIYTTIDYVISKVIDNSDGWIKYCCKSGTNISINNLKDIMNLFSIINDNSITKLFPHREKRTKYKVINTIELKNNGNFKLIACETNIFYYIFCFATS